MYQIQCHDPKEEVLNVPLYSIANNYEIWITYALIEQGHTVVKCLGKL